ncbi:hypothetical protein [Streptomyces sp. c-19]|uniref:hypothetical protein n=1 Tax=Streptomyces sp. c-19 TaxID=2789275 RepID=UPI00397EED15
MGQGRKVGVEPCGHTRLYGDAEYEPAHGPTGPHRYTFGGLTDTAFRMVGLVEAGSGAARPWTVVHHGTP